MILMIAEISIYIDKEMYYNEYRDFRYISCKYPYTLNEDIKTKKILLK